jgi:hypothetical protein
VGLKLQLHSFAVLVSVVTLAFFLHKSVEGIEAALFLSGTTGYASLNVFPAAPVLQTKQFFV